MTSDDQNETTPRRSTRARQFAERVKKVDIAIQLDQLYEFEVKEGKATLLPEAPAARQSWTSLGISSTFKQDRFNVGTRDAYVDLPVGVTAVLGKSGAGKTRFAFEHLFARAVIDKRPARFYRLFEPGYEAYFTRIAGAALLVRKPTFEIEFAKQLAEDLCDAEQDLLIVDSFRYLFYSSSGGATGPGGVNMSLFMQLTHLDIMATQLSKRLVILINPLTNNDEAYSNYIEACKGAVTTTISVRSFDTLELTTRIGPTRGNKIIKIGASTVLDNPQVSREDQADDITMHGGQDLEPIRRLIGHPSNGARK